MVTEQIANLSAGNRRLGSSPSLSASKVLFRYNLSGRSVVRSSRLVWDQEVAGSNPAAPTIKYFINVPFSDIFEIFFLKYRVT